MGLARPADVSPAGQRVLITEQTGGRLSAIDLATGQVSAVASGLGEPWGVAADDEGRRAYVSTFDGATFTGSLLAVDVSTGGVTTIASGLSSPRGVTLNDAETTAYLIQFRDFRGSELSAIDLATGATTTLATGMIFPTFVELDAAETLAYVTDAGSGEILAVNLADGRITAVACQDLTNPTGIALGGRRGGLQRGNLRPGRRVADCPSNLR